jgi:hypothetical protein
MSSKYGVLSLLVFCVVLLLILKNYEIWTQPIELSLEKGVGRKPESKPENKPGSPSAGDSQKDPASIQSYILIAEKNIFSPERKDFPIPTTTEGKKPLVRPQIVLYGVTILGDYQAASVTNPGRPLQKGERETMTLKIGEKIGEYKLAKVSSDRITFEAEGDSFEVLLYDPRVPKRRTEVKTETKPAAVTSTLPAAPSSISPEGPKPAPPVAEAPKVPAQGRVSTPPPSPIPRPNVPSVPSFRGGRSPFYPRSRTPVPQGTPAPRGTPAPPVTPAPEEEEEEDDDDDE